MQSAEYRKYRKCRGAETLNPEPGEREGECVGDERKVIAAGDDG